jgi:hypothetical protein
VVKNFKNLPQISKIIGIHSNEIIRIIIIRGKKNRMILCLYVVKNFKNLPQISQIIGIHSNEIIRIIIIRGEKNGMILCLYVVKNFKNLPQISQIMRINLNKILLNPFNPWPKKTNKSSFLLTKTDSKKGCSISFRNPYICTLKK